MIKAMIFDLDGTIGDTVPLCIAAFKKSVEPLAGRVFSEEEIVSTFGPSEEGTIKALIPEFYEEGLSEFLWHYKNMHDMCPSPFPGMKEVVERLKAQGIIVAMVTGKGRHSCDITLKHYGMDGLFEMIETGCPGGPRKVEGIQAVLKQFNLQPQEALYIGDAVTDIHYSREAGVPVIAAAWASGADEERLSKYHPDAVCTSVEALQQYLTMHCSPQ